MCTGSVRAKDQEDAQVGQSYSISDGGHGGPQIGVLHRQDRGPDAQGYIACAACIRTETMVHLTGIPTSVQEKHGIGPAVTALFVPDDGEWNDWIEFKGGNRIPLIEFAHPTVRLELTEAMATPAQARKDALVD